MLLEFIAVIAAGFGAAGIVMALRWLSRGRLPKWSVPVAAGLGMIAFIIWSEQTWAGRLVAQLPPEVEVASTNAERSWFRPWTYVWPRTSRIRIVDHRFTRRNPAFPDLVMTRVMLLGRWQPARPIEVVFDCRANRRADLDSGVVITETGALEGAQWVALEADDPLLRAACDTESGNV